MNSQRPLAFACIALFVSLASPLMASPTQSPAAPQTPPAPTGTQSGAADHAALQERVKALEAELAAAKARIAELEADLAQRAQPPQPTPTQPTTQPAGAEAEQGHVVSVSQFFAKAKAEYAVAFPPAAPGDTTEAPAALKRSLERFAVSINRAWKQQIRWTAVLKKADRAADGTTLTVQPLNDDGSARGEPIAMRVDTVRNRRLDTILQRAQLEETYVFNGLFVPRLTANTDRMKEGVFNNPPLVGPGIEFRYEIMVDGIATVKPDTGKGDAKDSGKNAPAAPTPR